jgi:hypothetical protein
VGEKPALLRNDGARSGNWLSIRAQGSRSNRFGLGTRVDVTVGGKVQSLEITNVASYLSSSDTRLHIGAGAAKVVERIELLWPSGERQALRDVPVNQVLVVKEP